MSSALVILATGVEEMEFVGSVDVLRRAGVTVTVAGLDGAEPVKCSRDIVIVPDVALSTIDKDSFDVIVLPGGIVGAKKMSESPLVGFFLQHQEKNDKLIAAICASPAMVLRAHEIGKGKKITCYPSFKDEIGEDSTYVDEIVVQDGKLITSQGPSTVFAFALKIVENLVGVDMEKQVSDGILLNRKIQE